MLEGPARKSHRLPNDTAGILEDRIEADRHDFEAYLALARYQRDKTKLEDARETYEKLLKVVPACALVWIEFAELETSANEFQRVEQIFTKCLQTVLNVELWSYYLAYIRRMNDLSTGGSQVRATIAQAYEFVLSHVGVDPKAGAIWLEYLQFIKSAPTNSQWEEQQQQDQLRRTYQRAVATPLSNVEQLWREYDLFENTANQATARKFLSERSPAYMTARACARELLQIIEPLRQGTFPVLPTRSPEEMAYVTSWRRWIGWEMQNPLEHDNPEQLRARVKYAYKQCLQYCRFFPEMWFDAALYWASIGEDELAFYEEGLEANPKSWLLAFAYAEAEELAKRGDNVKSTFDNLIASNKQDMAKQEEDIAAFEAAEKTDKKVKIGEDSSSDSESDDEEQQDGTAVSKLDELKAQLQARAEEHTTAYIMYMRAMRRLEGIKSARSIFARAIKEPRHTWHIYVASALMEHHCSKDSNVAVKIFSRGLKQHSENTDFVLEYLNFLIAIKDDTNARALFEQTTAKVEGRKVAKLFERFYAYESMYGDLTTAQKLATRMSEIDPSANRLTRFGKRFTFAGCDPIASRDLGLVPLHPGANSLPALLPPPPFMMPVPGVIPPMQGQSPAPQMTFVPPPPLPPAVLDLLKRLPPSTAMDATRKFHAKALMDVVISLDLEAYKVKQQKQAKVGASTTAKRKAAAAIPPPEDLRPLGKHNDAKDIYIAKKRA